MPTTPSGHGTKPRSKRKRTDNPPLKHRPIDRAHHTEGEDHAIDAAIERRLPARPLRLRIQHRSRRLHEALGPRHQELWLNLEAALNELTIQREAAYFDLGFEHGFAAGRSSTAKRMPAGARALAATLRDLAIQHGSREDALAAVLDAACALAVEAARPGAGRKKKTTPGARTATAGYASAASARAGASIIRDASCTSYHRATPPHDELAERTPLRSNDPGAATDRPSSGAAGVCTYRYSNGQSLVWGDGIGLTAGAVELERAVDRA